MLSIGQSVESKFHITDEVVRAFAEFSGDKNPIHLDESFAAKSPFGKRIAHGIISGTFISSMIANQLPGPGTIYLGQNYKFINPVFVGEWITIKLTVKSIRADKPIATLETNVYVGDEQRLALEGEATVRFPR